MKCGAVIECTPQNVGELVNKIRALQSALAHIIMRNHDNSVCCSACEEATKLHNEYIKGE
jgi:hypothetical protein